MADVNLDVSVVQLGHLRTAELDTGVMRGDGKIALALPIGDDAGNATPVAVFQMDPASARAIAGELLEAAAAADNDEPEGTT